MTRLFSQILLLALAFTAAPACVEDEPSIDPIVADFEDWPREGLFHVDTLQSSYNPLGYVAHALGGIDGQVYTNSAEAFAFNYARGFRLFEVDLVRLADGVVVAAHDEHEGDYGLDARFHQLDAEQVAGASLHGEYALLDAEALIDLLRAHHDAFLILDAKAAPRSLSPAEKIEQHVQIVGALVDAAGGEIEVIDRLVPHVSGPEALAGLRELHDFKDFMFAIYQSDALAEPNLTDAEVAAFVREERIGATMMWWNRRYSAQFAQRLRDAGSLPYVHTIESQGQAEWFRKRGVGVYTDEFFPDE